MPETSRRFFLRDRDVPCRRTTPGSGRRARRRAAPRRWYGWRSMTRWRFERPPGGVDAGQPCERRSEPGSRMKPSAATPNPPVGRNLPFPRAPTRFRAPCGCAHVRNRPLMAVDPFGPASKPDRSDPVREWERDVGRGSTDAAAPSPPAQPCGGTRSAKEDYSPLSWRCDASDGRGRPSGSHAHRAVSDTFLLRRDSRDGRSGCQCAAFAGVGPTARDDFSFTGGPGTNRSVQVGTMANARGDAWGRGDLGDCRESDTGPRVGSSA